jgi:hypothetical protein
MNSESQVLPIDDLGIDEVPEVAQARESKREPDQDHGRVGRGLVRRHRESRWLRQHEVTIGEPKNKQAHPCGVK